MGQALRKLESFYEKVGSGNGFSEKIHRKFIENSHIYNNLDNDDYDYKVLIAKSNALKMYLARNLDRNKIENTEEVGKVTIRLVGKAENEYLSVEEAAKYLDCTTKTIRNRINKDGMPYLWDRNKKMISIENLEKWRHGKPDGVKIPLVEEVEELEQDIKQEVKIVENSEVSEYIPSVVENFVTRDELNSYTMAIKDFTETINNMKQENKLELEKAISLQMDTFISMFEELKKEKDRELRESHATIKNIIEDMERREGDIITRAITAWREEKEKERLGKRSWWKRLFS